MRHIILPEPEYWTSAQAAAYLGYTPRTLWQHCCKYNIPKYGPQRNRYKKADLDAYMADPFCFVEPKRQKRPGGGFTPVRI